MNLKSISSHFLLLLSASRKRIIGIVFEYHVDSNKRMGSVMYFSPLRNVLKIKISFRFFSNGSDEFFAALVEAE